MRPALLLVLLSACGSTLQASAVQPNPLLGLNSVEQLPVGVTLYIHTRDKDLPRYYQLRSFAEFAVITRDRLRFHVGIARTYEEEASTRGWRVWLEDERGHRYQPASREVARVDRLALEWRPEYDDRFQRVFKYRREPEEIQAAYCGKADYVFYIRGIMAPARRMLALNLERGRQHLRFVWRFAEGTEIHHYGRSRTDEELGFIVIPGPDTRVAETRYEGE